MVRQSYQLPATSFQIMLVLAIIVLLMPGCAPSSAETMQRIALLAPFEGRDSEIGYDAYYAARLAIQNGGFTTVELLAVDDGGSRTSAGSRVKALVNDPTLRAIIALGYNATAAETQRAVEIVPMIIVGDWQAEPTSPNVFIMTNQDLGNQLTTPSTLQTITDATEIDYSVVGGEIFALQQFQFLNPDYKVVTIVSSAGLPDETFRQQFMSSGQYVPEPGLLATLTYDAVGMTLQAIKQQDTVAALATTPYSGLNGVIQFKDGYWIQAPTHYYRYDDNGRLLAVDGSVK